jgi:uncharacterized protein
VNVHHLNELPRLLQLVAVRSAGLLTQADLARDARLRHLQEVLGPRFLRGVLLYTGASSVPFGKDLFTLPVSALWET